MAKQALWPRVRAGLAIFFYAILTLGALHLAEDEVGGRGLMALRQLYTLSHLPTRPLGQTWTRAALVRGRLLTAKLRYSPSGTPSAIWYAWVEDQRRSGKNSYTVIVCSEGETDELELQQDGHTATLDLIEPDNQSVILKGTFLETLPLDRVALDLGPSHHTRDIPPAMRERCGSRIPPLGGNLTYFELAVPLGSPVTVLGCARPEVLHRCGPPASPPGFLTVRELRYLLRAYANHTLDRLRASAAFVCIALGLLAAALFKRQKAATGAS